MSRSYNAKRKAKRQQARSVAAPAPRRHVRSSRRLGFILPLLAIAAVLAATAVLGFGADNATSREEVDREVSELLAGIPQEGPMLGEPKAPITLRVFADLECPTVRRFVVSRLPSIISTWVRNGVIKLEYRSLETDTVNERTFFTQEAAALAVGRQDRMWDFVLTAVHEQQYKLIDLGQKGFRQVTGIQHSDYVDDGFLTDIASRVSGLNMARWRQDRDDGLLFKQVAQGIHLAHTNDLHATPAFMIGRTGDETYHRVGSRTERNYLINAASLDRDIEGYLGRSAAYLRQHGFPEVSYGSSKE